MLFEVCTVLGGFIKFHVGLPSLVNIALDGSNCFNMVESLRLHGSCCVYCVDIGIVRRLSICDVELTRSGCLMSALTHTSLMSVLFHFLLQNRCAVLCVVGSWLLCVFVYLS